MDMDTKQLDNLPDDSDVRALLEAARKAEQSDNDTLATDLYLAAFDASCEGGVSRSEGAISGLKTAWSIACDLGNRDLAQHIYDKLEEYLTNQEMSFCMRRMGAMVLDKLADFGMPREIVERLGDRLAEGPIGSAPHVSIHMERIPLGALGDTMDTEVSADVMAITSDDTEQDDDMPDIDVPDIGEILADIGAGAEEDSRAEGFDFNRFGDPQSLRHGGLPPKDLVNKIFSEAFGKAQIRMGDSFDDDDAEAQESILTDSGAAGGQGHGEGQDFSSPIDDLMAELWGNPPKASDDDVEVAAKAWIDEERRDIPEASAKTLPHDMPGICALIDSFYEAALPEQMSCDVSAPPARHATDASDEAAELSEFVASMPEPRISGAKDEDASAISPELLGKGGKSRSVKGHDSAHAGGISVHADGDMASHGSKKHSSKRGHGTLGSLEESEGEPARLHGNNPAFPDEPENYAKLAGFDEAIRAMEPFGIGSLNKVELDSLTRRLNAAYGVDGIPAADSLLFRSPAREDSAYFMDSTVAELNLPVLYLSMEENNQGQIVLRVFARAGKMPKMNQHHATIEVPAVLCLENLDGWCPPDMFTDENGHIHMPDGARDLVALIRNCVEDPKIYVMANMSSYCDVDPFFYDLLAPMSVIDIANPTTKERHAIWRQLIIEHPALGALSVSDLVRLSANMPRADIRYAVREAIDEAYKQSLQMQSYVPITSDNLFEKLSAYQPVDSGEYRLLEDSVVATLREELDTFDSVDALLGLDGSAPA